ncbi:PREDICTED: VIN3-like protein 2 isoform X3 [Lupinus angustifolius]|uniref:VIN3-like protein 2 isoform X3 n=1 Tax=Lupinus angustifolius TaxID=3871 RepID=UPI00092F22D9|nr:PREDICTED: VIN3-like protein 2 isoform X3 [Lupinus angustifolius]
MRTLHATFFLSLFTLSLSTVIKEKKNRLFLGRIMREEEEEHEGCAKEFPFSDLLLDREKCTMMSLQDKQKLVHKIAQQSKDASNMLHSFTRRELLEIICAELGAKRKYTGYTKGQMIENLLKIISKESKLNSIKRTIAHPPAKSHIGPKRKKVASHDLHYAPQENSKEGTAKALLCQNVACRATLTSEDSFCKRCSCCICLCYDDNKDPSLWLTCSSDLPGEESCGRSCHLQCALSNESSGILKDSWGTKLDGSFLCACGKNNELMSTWRKQLLAAKEARRVDILSLRVSLARRILIGTEVYIEVHKIVESALELLNNEVGPLDQECARMTRGIVSRLSCGAEVQKLCYNALECFDSKFSNLFSDGTGNKNTPAACSIRFEECLPTSVIIVLDYKDHHLKKFLGCRLWHRISTTNYPEQPTFIVLRPEKRFKLENLHPSTEYFCKASLFSSTGVLSVAEAKWVTPSKPMASSKVTEKHYQLESANSDMKLSSRRHLILDNSKSSFEEFLARSPSVESLSCKTFAAVSPTTPSKSNEMRQSNGFTSKKHGEENDYEYSVRVVKCLEHEGHIAEIFRIKFLTWFSLKASQQERRVVSAFVDALNDDPASLADQLIHTFTDEIFREQKSH